MTAKPYVYEPPKRRPCGRRAFDAVLPYVDSSGKLYSDGYLIVRGQPPREPTRKSIHIRSIFYAQRDATIAQPMGVIGDFGTDGCELVVFRIGRLRKPRHALAFIDAKKLDYALHGHEGPFCFRINTPRTPLGVYEGRRVFAVIMPVIAAPTTVEMAVKTLLQNGASHD